MAETFGAQSTADKVLSSVDLKRKQFLITGVSSGIGLETARSLTARGACVVGAVRDIGKAELATATVRNAASKGGGSLELIRLDLASLQRVRACADNLLADGRSFDAMIANAGIMASNDRSDGRWLRSPVRNQPSWPFRPDQSGRRGGWHGFLSRQP